MKKWQVSRWVVSGVLCLATAMPGCLANSSDEPAEQDGAMDEGVSDKQDGAQRTAVQASIQVDKPYLTIPRSFLGLSQEWPWLGSLTGNPQIIGMTKQLSAYNTGPMILRVGGASADQQKTVPVKGVWEGLARLYRDAGVHYILGLNLAAADVELAKSQFLAARQGLPAEALLSFEIGNEPNYYWAEGYRSTQNWLNGYPAQFRKFGETLACTSTPCAYRQFAGPAWGHIFMEPEKLDWVLGSFHHLLNLITVHFYKDTKETYNDPVTMLDEPALQKAMASLRLQVAVGKKYGIPVRVGESNSISNGGRTGVSDAFTSALWAVDTTFELAHNGAVGVNYHQASHYGFFEMVKDASTGQTSVYARPCYLGYLFFQQAVSGDSALLPKKIQGSAQVKVWPIQQGNELRLAVVNKDPRQADVRIDLDSSAYGDGTLTRLLAPSLTAMKGVTLAGQSYDAVGGKPSGSYRSESVKVNRSGSSSSYAISLPPFSAALLVVKK